MRPQSPISNRARRSSLSPARSRPTARCSRRALWSGAMASARRCDKLLFGGRVAWQLLRNCRPHQRPPEEIAMTRAELTEKLLDIKREKGWSWKQICSDIGSMSPVLITGALLGQMKLTKSQAARAAELFGL